MKYTSFILAVVLAMLHISCISQKMEKKTESADSLLLNIYNSYYEHRQNYATDQSAGRDSIMQRFKNELKSYLSQPQYAQLDFKALKSHPNVHIITSEDQKLKIFSWDLLNGGTNHTYDNVFVWIDEHKTQTGKINNDESMYLKAYLLPDNSYLTIAYGTKGAGTDYYTLRKLSWQNQHFTDCEACFEGENKLVYTKPRADDSYPIYNITSKTISFPEYRKEEETGFFKPTGDTTILKYTNGKFTK
ncbi:hypothetical protein [Fulvivirga sediminis]|uniref:Uncharacterized protein n=1 Tax=Fulvivirga sediminis TaxID=2803949 RepID=A0A937FEK5_9BACT|nr:hypothetical protein [Fulvivirga sediminis]MBL3659083.1 hypothetical protein [Fulvivirga sediminis]